MMMKSASLSLLLLVSCSHGFAPPSVQVQRGSPLALLGRFRKKKKLEIADPIQVGGKIPDLDVELLTTDDKGKVATVPISAKEVMGKGKSVLVGMPGAFTPVCTSEHMPGYIFAAPKLKELGIDHISVITTNDKFVNEEWARNVGLITEDGKKSEGGADVSIVADGDAEFVKALGLAEDMGFGVGVRSQRFTLVAENGVVTNILTDEAGMDVCDSTSAANLVKLLTPEGEGDMEEMDVDPQVLAVGGVVLFAALAFMSSGGDAGTTTTAATTAAVGAGAVKAGAVKAGAAKAGAAKAGAAKAGAAKAGAAKANAGAKNAGDFSLLKEFGQ